MRHNDDDQRWAAQIATWAPRVAGKGLVVMREKDKREGAPSLFGLVAAELTRRGTASSVAWLRTPDGINPSLAHVAAHVTSLNEADIVIAVDYARAIILKIQGVTPGTAPVLVRDSTTVRGRESANGWILRAPWRPASPTPIRPERSIPTPSARRPVKRRHSRGSWPRWRRRSTLATQHQRSTIREPHGPPWTW